MMKSNQYMKYLGVLLIILSVTDIVGAILSCTLLLEKYNGLPTNMDKGFIITVVISSLVIITALFKFYCGIKGILEVKEKNKSNKYVKIAKILFIINTILVIAKWIQVFTMNGEIRMVSISTASVVVLYQFNVFTKAFIANKGK